MRFNVQGMEHGARGGRGARYAGLQWYAYAGSPARVLKAERAVVDELGGGCQMPIGAHATVSGDTIALTSVVIAPDGSRVARAAAEGPRSGADAVGRMVARQLLAAGADDILARIRATDHTSGSRT